MNNERERLTELLERAQEEHLAAFEANRNAGTPWATFFASYLLGHGVALVNREDVADWVGLTVAQNKLQASLVRQHGVPRVDDYMMPETEGVMPC